MAQPARTVTIKKAALISGAVFAALLVLTPALAAPPATHPAQISFVANGGVSRSGASKLSDSVSAKDFGAAGDGVTDDTAAVNSAVALAGSITGVTFPCPGTYLTSNRGTLACGPQYLQVKFPSWGLNPSTNIPSIASNNTALTAQQGGFPAETPLFLQALENDSLSFYAKPQIYLSRFDSSPYIAPGASPGVTSCFNGGPLASCDAPLLLIAGTNQTTGNIPAMVGVDCNLWGFKANGTSPPIQANFETCYGANVADTATDNIVNIQAANFITNVFGNPTHTGPGGFTRHGNGIEIDISNGSGNDSGFTSGGGTGNYILGESLVAFGANNSTGAIFIDSSAGAGIGWQNGVTISAVKTVGVGVYKGGPAPAFSPISGIHVSTAGTNGVVVGSGTITETKNVGSSDGNPTNGIVLDSQGTAGVNETQNSNTVVFNTKVAATSATAITLQAIAASQALSISGKVTLAPIVFASLGTPANGTIAYCSDCVIANPCAGAGTGALAKRLNGVWVCN